jgi:cytokinesis protein
MIWRLTYDRLSSAAQKCKSENQTLAEERAAIEKRKAQAQEAKEAREKVKTEAAQDASVLDNLLDKLRSGDAIPRKARKNRPKPSSLSDIRPSPLGVDVASGETVDVAKSMLAALQMDGFDAIAPATPSARPARTSRRTRLRAGTVAAIPDSDVGEDEQEGESPAADEIPEVAAGSAKGTPNEAESSPRFSELSEDAGAALRFLQAPP